MAGKVKEQTALFVTRHRTGNTVRSAARRANDLDGRQWQKNSISVWHDIRKTDEERKLHHPALFPTMLVRRLLESFTNSSDRVVLDPFMGSGSTLVAAREVGKCGIGFEISPEYARLARRRLSQLPLDGYAELNDEEATRVGYNIILDDAREIPSYLDRESVDICITSPPYWDILSRKRTADGKATRDYGCHKADLSVINGYDEFLAELVKVFQAVCRVLKNGRYCIINVMDLRKGNRFFPYHSDLATRLAGESEFVWDDLIIWDRSAEYNNIRPLGYPSVFRVNKVHEYLLIMRKFSG